MASFLLVYKDVWEHHYLLLLPFFCLLWLSSVERRRCPTRATLKEPSVVQGWAFLRRLSLGVFCLLTLPSPFADTVFRRVTDVRFATRADLSVLALHHLWKPFPVLLLFSSLIVCLLREASGRSSADRMDR